MKTKALILFATILISITSAYAKVRCANFSTQSEAQTYMETHGAKYLDRDRDGEACECLPGGSKHGSPICRRSL